jgi:3-hydroxybutyryl-CoA dehydrogenase
LPQRLVGMHFFNPVPLMALVEVVHGLATDGEVADIVFATASAWGKSPVHAKSTPGFIVNRVARPFYGEALRLLQEQAGDCATIDAVMREAGGFRMGPFELMDLIGHDVNFSVTQSVFHAYFCDPRFTPSVLQQEIVNAGFLGRKSGRGFYRYGPDAVAPQPHVEAPQARPEFVDCSTLAGPALLLAERLRASGVNFGLHRAEIDEEDTAAFYCNGAALHLSDGRSATERARANNHPDTVLFDLALDYRAATRIAVSRADQCSCLQQRRRLAAGRRFCRLAPRRRARTGACAPGSAMCPRDARCSGRCRSKTICAWVPTPGPGPMRRPIWTRCISCFRS